LRVATVVLGAPDGAEDVLQEAMERAWRAMGRFRDDAAFRPWFLRIVANAARNERRSKGRRAHLVVRAGAAYSRRATVSAEDEVVTEDERRRVVGALNRLDADDRLTIGLRFFEQLSEREMAEVLACAPGTVKSRLSRAKARLRAELERAGGEREEVARHG
jgi:RNA polymerase sigma-70 factor (ECF subfamily)